MIIGLSGFARSGKNTVADILGKRYKQIAFADPMRDALVKLNPVIHSNGATVRDMVDEYGWDIAKVQYPEIRRLLQVIGTEVGRHMFGDNIWVDIALRGVLPADDIVITDVRFKNEARAIKNLGGQVWRITREGVEALNEHISEHALDDWVFDRIIENNGTIEELQRIVEEEIHHALTG